jgi:hypothetical protein
VQNAFGVSIVGDYYRFQKFNVMELANEYNEPERLGRGAYKIRSKMIMIMGLCYKAVTAATCHYTGYLFNEDIIGFKNSTSWNWRMRIMNRKDLKKRRGAYKTRSKKMMMGLCRR